MEWETVIGLEIHAQLATRARSSPGASTAYGAEPNTQACWWISACPGVLPVLNAEACAWRCVRPGHRRTIAPRSVFARKNYFYPTCPRATRSASTSCPSCTRPLDIVLDDGTARPSASPAPTWRRMPASRCTRISTA
jgi:aspartyl-tRNA(Asn)/glutamyl-tRNA(Gln) amidotransferase subunit B